MLDLWAESDTALGGKAGLVGFEPARGRQNPLLYVTKTPSGARRGVRRLDTLSDGDLFRLREEGIEGAFCVREFHDSR